MIDPVTAYNVPTAIKAQAYAEAGVVELEIQAGQAVEPSTDLEAALLADLATAGVVAVAQPKRKTATADKE